MNGRHIQEHWERKSFYLGCHQKEPPYLGRLFLFWKVRSRKSFTGASSSLVFSRLQVQSSWQPRLAIKLHTYRSSYSMMLGVKVWVFLWLINIFHCPLLQEADIWVWCAQIYVSRFHCYKLYFNFKCLLSIYSIYLEKWFWIDNFQIRLTFDCWVRVTLCMFLVPNSYQLCDLQMLSILWFSSFERNNLSVFIKFHFFVIF